MGGRGRGPPAGARRARRGVSAPPAGDGRGGRAAGGGAPPRSAGAARAPHAGGGRVTGALRARLGAAAGVAILGVVLWRLGTGAFVDGLRTIDGPTLLAAVGLGLLTTVFSAWRWCLVARGLRIRLPLGPAVADYYRALFLNAALPGGVLGDVHRAVRHGRDAGDVGRGVRAVVLERVAGQVVLIAVGAAILLAHPSLALEHTGRLIGGPAAAWAL
ncbi:lysylphosphatidylglycerol synthase transmembrane domain-containing protein, partial [Streptomyces asiaticus]|uniref:lysylphosphatidylglycerol synthase transmembrane domain-containing protein n=1 Tax=Streptomyces asiaticus TaxID=114695 RepID=UPI0039BE1720